MADVDDELRAELLERAGRDQTARWPAGLARPGPGELPVLAW